MSQQRHPASPENPPSLENKTTWPKIKAWPIIAKIAAIGCGGIILLFIVLIALGLILWAVNPDGMQEIADEQEQERAEQAEDEAAEAEEEAEREAEEEAAREEAEAEEAVQEEAEEEEEPPEPTEEPEPKTLDEKLDDLASLESLDDSEVYYAEDTGDIHVYDERDPGLSNSTMCNGARDATLKVLEYVQENIDEDYNNLWLEFTARGEEDATGDAPILGMATVVYTAETVDEIDASPMNLSAIWETRDEGSIAQNCQ